jgi:hypothetical protein
MQIEERDIDSLCINSSNPIPKSNQKGFLGPFLNVAKPRAKTFSSPSNLKAPQIPSPQKELDIDFLLQLGSSAPANAGFGIASTLKNYHSVDCIPIGGPNDVSSIVDIGSQKIECPLKVSADLDSVTPIDVDKLIELASIARTGMVISKASNKS